MFIKYHMLLSNVVQVTTRHCTCHQTSCVSHRAIVINWYHIKLTYKANRSLSLIMIEKKTNRNLQTRIRKYKRKYDTDTLNKIGQFKSTCRKELLTRIPKSRSNTASLDIHRAFEKAMDSFDSHLGEEYNVSLVQKFRINRPVDGVHPEHWFEFDVRYEGYESEENWQPASNIEDCEAFIEFCSRADLTNCSING